MRLFAGCYNFRAIKDSNRLGAQSWGVGIDIDSRRTPSARRTMSQKE